MLEPWVVILLGSLAALIPDALRIIKYRYAVNFSKYLNAPMFWIGLLLLILVGGLAAWLGHATETKEALAYGYGVPELLSRLLSSKQKLALADPAIEEFSLRQWWSR